MIADTRGSLSFSPSLVRATATYTHSLGNKSPDHESCCRRRLWRVCIPIMQQSTETGAWRSGDKERDREHVALIITRFSLLARPISEGVLFHLMPCYTRRYREANYIYEREFRNHFLIEFIV